MALFNKSGKQWREILILAIGVLLFRFFYVEILNYLQADYQYNFFDLLQTIFKEYPVTLFMVISGFLSVRYINKLYSWGENTARRILLFALAFFLITSLVTLMLCMPELKVYSWDELIASKQLEALFIVSAMLNILIMGATDVFLYYRKSHKKALDAEIFKRNKARFQYEQLKRQLNPHFLFNSLNVLDYLVRADPDRASNFIRKLAGVYRYLLSKDSDPIVPLEEEINFVNMYIDLLKERFTDGLEVAIELDESSLKTFVIPCSIQLLIENAIKHNIISKALPLTIRIYKEDNYICVENNLQIRLSVEHSNKLGLKNIEGQYQALFGKNISIHRTAEKFLVRLPIVCK